MASIAKILIKTLVPLAILAGGYLGAKHLMATSPTPAKIPPVDRTPVVEVQEIAPSDYTVYLRASGLVNARTQSNLVSEVAGKVLEISPEFRAGAYFNKGDWLLTLDDTNYRDAIQIANSNISANEAALAQLDQEERNTYTSLQLARQNLGTLQKNLQLAQKNTANVRRKEEPVRRNTGLIQQNLALARKNLELGKRNLALAKKELARTRDLGQRRLIPLTEAEAQEQKVLQLEQALLQQQQNIVQQEQQLSQQDQSLVQQDQNELQQQQAVLQQQQAVNQQNQSISTLQGQLATFASRRNALKANNELIRTQLLQQERNLGRTRITAPYSGRILEQRADLGQYIAANGVLGVIYATDYLEVSLPLTLEQFSLLELPDQPDSKALDALPVVEFSASFGEATPRWKGRITGTRATLDVQSRQITVVARIDQTPEAARSNQQLKLGQYLNARIQGKTFRQRHVVPSASVRQNRDVLLFQENQVKIAPVQVLWADERDAVLAGLEPRPVQLITTLLGQASDGMRVALPGQKKKPERRRPEGAEAGQPSPTGEAKPERRRPEATPPADPAAAPAADATTPPPRQDAKP